MKIEIEVGRELFRFSSFKNWVNMAQSLFRSEPGANMHTTVCIDAKGRICNSGREFRRAEEADAYPVRVFAIDEGALDR